MTKIRIGTRGSKLALWQANWVAEQLRGNDHEVELVTVSTKGDVSSQSLSQVGGQGVFTKEIQQQLLNGDVDVAVHSLKDLPTLEIEGLSLAAVPPRETTRDCLISRDGETFEDLQPQSRIGTGSLRRGAQLLAWREDIVIADIRGNVDSRLRKLREGEYDAIILAAAGLSRLGLSDQVTETLNQTRVLPAIGQGALGLECRASDDNAKQALNALNHPESFAAVTAERQLLASLLAGCMAPVAALAEAKDGDLTLQARVISPDGRRVVDKELAGAISDARLLGGKLAQQMLDDGAAELIAIARKSPNNG